MEKNAVAATVGLGAIGIMLAFYGLNTYNIDGNPAVALDTVKTSATDPQETSTNDPPKISENKLETTPSDEMVKRQLLSSKIADLKSRVSLLEEDKTEQPLSTTKSKKVTLEVNDTDKNMEKIREGAKHEVAEETDVWSTFWKNEYDKQKDGDEACEF